jgi:hypothetical protein
MPVAIGLGTMPPERCNAAKQSRRKDVLRRLRLVNGHVEGRNDRPRFRGRHGAAARELHRRRSVETTEHDAEAPLQCHLIEHFRRRSAAAKTAGHSRLVPLRSAP